MSIKVTAFWCKRAFSPLHLMLPFNIAATAHGDKALPKLQTWHIKSPPTPQNSLNVHFTTDG